MSAPQRPLHVSMEEMIAVITDPATYRRTRYSGAMRIEVIDPRDFPEHFDVRVFDSAGTCRRADVWLDRAEELAATKREGGVPWSRAAWVGLTTVLTRRDRGRPALRDECRRDSKGVPVVRTTKPPRGRR